ncbi:MAG: hypothetical protein ACI843_002188, partial [Psychrobacter glaciei]
MVTDINDGTRSDHEIDLISFNYRNQLFSWARRDFLNDARMISLCI